MMRGGILELFLEALFPGKCLLCGNFFRPPGKRPDFLSRISSAPHPLLSRDEASLFRELMAPFLCAECALDFVPFTSSLLPVKSIRTVHAAGVYDRALLEVIHHYKYGGKSHLARPLGLMLLAVFLRACRQDMGDDRGRDTVDAFGKMDVIIPVPLHIRRFRKRGYNQSYLLIRNWIDWIEKLSGHRPGWVIDRDSLIKHRRTPSQTRFGREARQKNVRDAYCLKDDAMIADKYVLLVDDVYTTGATVDECARVLLQGGAKRVDVLTVAGALSHSPRKVRGRVRNDFLSD